MVAPELALAPVTPLCATVQLKDVPLTSELRAILVVPPLHNVCDAGLADTFGVGFTVTTTFVGVPLQLFAVPVTEYVAVPALVPAFDNVCAIVAPELALAPVTPDCVTVHAKLVPLTPELKAILLVPALHKICDAGLAVTTGNGLTVIITFDEEPLQPLAVAVTL